MKKFAFFEITEDMTPMSVANAMDKCKKGGYDKVIVFHAENADIRRERYITKLLALFRAAYRSKAEVYLCDDSFCHSGTGFGQISSVRDVWQKDFEKNCPENTKYPYGHYPDLTDGRCVKMAIDSVYAPLLREFAKFKGYEFKGFVCCAPLYSSVGGAAYSAAAMEKFEEKYKREPDLINEIDKGEYEMLCQKAMEENYIVPLKHYCGSCGMELVVVGGEGSVSRAFAEREGMMFFDREHFRAENAGEALDCILKGYDVCVKIFSGMEKVAKTADFFATCGIGEVLDLHDFGKNEQNSYILCNMSDKTKSLGLLPEDDLVIYDAERDASYDFGKNTYTFYPHSFLCVKEKGDAFPEDLPVRCGGVEIGAWEEEKSLDIEKYPEALHFTLPDDKLSGKCLEVCGKWDYMKIKLGYNEFVFITEGCVLPLYDFLSGGEGTIWTEGGKIDKICIKRRQ